MVFIDNLVSIASAVPAKPLSEKSVRHDVHPCPLPEAPTPVPNPVITVSASPTSIHEGGTATCTIAASTPHPDAPITAAHPMGWRSCLRTTLQFNGSYGQMTIPACATSSSAVLRTAATNLATKSEKAYHVSPEFVDLRTAQVKISEEGDSDHLQYLSLAWSRRQVANRFQLISRIYRSAQLKNESACNRSRHCSNYLRSSRPCSNCSQNTQC